jgi:sulfate permease family protein
MAVAYRYAAFAAGGLDNASMIALLEARSAGLLSRHLPNLIAGVIVGVVALPLAMAFAIASGARPEQGVGSNRASTADEGVPQAP